MSDSFDTTELIGDMGERARAAAVTLARVPSARKAAALHAAAAAIRAHADAILAANVADVAAAQAGGMSGAMIDRLTLDRARLEGIATAVAAVAELRDPVGMSSTRAFAPTG